MKKDQKLPNKVIHKNVNSGKQLPDNYNNYRQQSPYGNDYHNLQIEDLQIEEVRKISHKTGIADLIVKIISIETSTQFKFKET